MNNSITSKEILIHHCKEIVKAQGLKGISIRSLAEHSGVSIGAIYNYFSSKDQLVSETTGAIWAEIFHFSEKSFEYDEFVKCLEELLWSIEKGKALYPHFFSAQAITISIGSSAQSLQTNYDYWSHIKESLVKILIIDKKIRPDVFDDNLTAEKFVDYVFELFLHVILSDDKNNGLIKFVQNSIY